MNFKQLQENTDRAFNGGARYGGGHLKCILHYSKCLFYEYGIL